MTNLGKSNRGKQILDENLIFGAVIIFSLIILYYIIHLTDLRPIADDYCSMSTSYDGPLLASLKYFTNVNGDLWAMFLYSLFVGSPLLIFGVAVGSAFTQIVLLFALIFLIDSTFRIIFPYQRLSNLHRYLLAICALLSWFQYWMLPRAKKVPLIFEFNGNLRLLSESILHWKTVQITYITVPISIVFLAILFNKTIKSAKIKYVMFFIIAVVVGLSGYIFAATSIATLIFVWKFKKFTARISGMSSLLYVGGILFGSCISFLSPGSVSRKQALANYPNLNIPVVESLNNSLSTAISMLLNLGVLSSILTGFVMGYLVRNSWPTARMHLLPDLKNTLLFSLVVAFLVTSAANHRVGWSSWHMLLPFTLNWLYWLLVGFSWNSKISTKSNYSRVTASIIIGVFLFASTIAIQTAIESISARLSAWNLGPAPTSGIEDREVDWVQNCMKIKIYG